MDFWQVLPVAIALVFIIEGLIPFLSPGRWRNMRDPTRPRHLGAVMARYRSQGVIPDQLWNTESGPILIEQAVTMGFGRDRIGDPAFLLPPGSDPRPRRGPANLDGKQQCHVGA